IRLYRYTATTSMKLPALVPSIVVLAMATAGVRTLAQNTPTPEPSIQNQTPNQRSRGMWGSGGMTGRGIMGTVTQAASDHFVIKTDAGNLYTIHFSVTTRIMKGGGGPRRSQSDSQQPFTPPESIKATEIKVGDAIAASGDTDANAKSLGAVVIFQIDPE